MGGVVNTAKKAVQYGYDTVVKAPASAVSGMYNTAKDGGSLGKIVGTGIKEIAKPTVDLGKDIVGSTLGGGDQAVPNIAEQEAAIQKEAAAKDAADKVARDRARRQAEIDVLTGTPGRGGTILTDQYQYKV